MGEWLRAVGGVEMLLTGLRSVLCLGAHVDDIEIGCGGALLRILAENPEVTVHYVVLSADEERALEARKSVDLLLRDAGNIDVLIGHFRESYFPYLGPDVKAYVHRLASEFDPDLVFTHWRGDAHQDHRTVAELTWNAFRQHLIMEYEIPKWDGDMGKPNVFVPLDRAVCEHKIEHLMNAFPSQAAKDWFDTEVFRGLLRLRGMEARSPSGYAEAFHCTKLVL